MKTKFELAIEAQLLRDEGLEPESNGKKTNTKQKTNPLAIVGVPSKYDSMNGLESRFAQHLELQLLSGEILSWEFEPIRVRVARGLRDSWYKPDFMVINTDGTITFYETKGHWKSRDRVRVKVAADKHRWAKFIGVTEHQKRWKYEYFV